MPKNSDGAVNQYEYTQNRELSWLQFNRRVLEESADRSVPLLERLKFISIFLNNMDEFFMVRVGCLIGRSVNSPKRIDNKTGMTPKEQLKHIYKVVADLVCVKDQFYHEVMRQLEKYGISDLRFEEATNPEKRFCDQYFEKQAFSVLTAQVVDSYHPFPVLKNKERYIAVLLRDKSGLAFLGLISIPSFLPSVLHMPGDSVRYIRMESLLCYYASTLFEGYTLESVCSFCVTRSADIDFDEKKSNHNTDDFRDSVRHLLKKRSKLGFVRLEIEGEIDKELLKILRRYIDLDSHQIYFNRSPLNIKYVSDLENKLSEEQKKYLMFPVYKARWPEDIMRKGSIIDQIKQNDKLQFFPYDSVEPFLCLLEEAAKREDVLAVQIALYRIDSFSKIARNLCLAAANGKEVTVLIELRARFDEANNIFWSQMLEKAGCRIVYGVKGFKCHSKICQIVLRDGEGLRYITQIGTGNYNEKTNAMYTDLSLMTASPGIGKDGRTFFQNLLIGNLNGTYQHLLVGPVGIKRKILELMDQEIVKGKSGYICVKANSLTERQTIDKLAEASAAGVQVQLILRGICCLRPGVPMKTENIYVTSIVGRYLEHARIYCFGKGKETKLYLSSADLMARNLSRRVEIACPVYDETIKKQLLWILQMQLNDNVKARCLLLDGSYHKKLKVGTLQNSQNIFMQESIHAEQGGQKRTKEEGIDSKKIVGRRCCPSSKDGLVQRKDLL